MSAGSNKIRVYVRTRPTPNFSHDVLKFLPDVKTINVDIKKDIRKGVVNNQPSNWSFKADGILHNATQEAVHDTISRKIISRAMEGYNGTIMCYGQTGAGKTFTMTGATESYKHRGIIPRALQQVFREIQERVNQAITVQISYLEIYNENLYDLLSTMPDCLTSESQMTIVDDPPGVNIKGLSVHLIHNEEEAFNLLFEGETNRIIAAHALNKNSSRSHCIFTIYLESHSRILSNAMYVTSKVNLVDLAGSERLGKTWSEGKILNEATYINKSLSFLEQTILALADRNRQHVPFRQSKLTYALKDSLGGNCTTILVANIFGEVAHIEETLSTLRFASRMRAVATKPVINEHCDPVRMVQKLELEIHLLKQELAMHDILVNRCQITYEPLSDSQIGEINSQVHQFLEGTLDEIEIINIRQLREVFSQFKLAGLVEIEGQAVGEVDGHGFGIEVAPFSSKPTSFVVSKRSKYKKSKEQTSPSPKKESPGTPSPGKELDSRSLSRMQPLVTSGKDLDGKDTMQREQDVLSTDLNCPDSAGKEEHSRPSSPPNKAVAFEEFKIERGCEISRILQENKSILSEKKRTVKELSLRINNVKQEIDVAKQELEGKRQEREEQGEYMNDGEVVIDEEEFELIVKLKDLKSRYRSDYDTLRDLKSEILYCQQLVEQCRYRLLTEFEIWYNESFLIPEDIQANLKGGGSLRPGLIPVNRVLALEEDDHERFECLQQELLMENPDSVSFYNAKMKIEQRHIYDKAVSQPQPTKKKPGVISAAVKNKPPTMLSIS
nr:PREDICTED: kinesin-like protein KIF9 [Latimeria chalumnae]|eukprot:XP_014340895.1 PREDICTED: kinesin-like protein KIF9 [Latimeria chalumnae]